MKDPASHLPEWVRITDPELAWQAMVAAHEGTDAGWLGRSWEHGGLELFRVEGVWPNARTHCSQTSLACRIKGRRFVVVWWPREPLEAPHVYHDTRKRKP